ncbi:ssDNA-binding protein [Sodalis sp.]|uniref:ssDNA-binding protein n=1 Tax=Sodalis sp. (in: enterobacteria) TaxID=1898979 RepID=UPI003872C699
MELFLNDVRLAYPNLFVPRDYKGDKKYKYSATFLIEKTRTELIAKIEAAIKIAAQEEWGAKYEAILRSIRSQKGQFNFRDGEEKADKAGFSGCMGVVE